MTSLPWTRRLRSWLAGWLFLLAGKLDESYDVWLDDAPRRQPEDAGEYAWKRMKAAEERRARLEAKLERLRTMLYDPTITYSTFCSKCGPMDEADPADPKYLGSPMMTETLPLREVVEDDRDA